MRLLAKTILLGIISSCLAGASGQETPDMAKGLSAYATYVPSEIDNYNPANGNIFLKIPLISLPQKGGKLRLNYYIYDNDKLWKVIGTNQIFYTNPITLNHGGYWDVQDPVLSWGDSSGGGGVIGTQDSPYVGAYVGTDQDVIIGTDTGTATVVYTPDQWNRQNVTTNTNSSFVLTPDESKHYVGEFWSQSCTDSGGGSCPSPPPAVYNFYAATDASGYMPVVANSAISAIEDSSGTTYTYSQNGAQETILDTNGNSIVLSGIGWTDTFGRSIRGSNSGTGSVVFPNDPNGAVPIGMGPNVVPGLSVSVSSTPCPSSSVGARLLQIPASQTWSGHTYENYYLCYSTYSYATNFNVYNVYPPVTNNGQVTISCGINEASSSSSTGRGQAYLLSAVILPDGNSYTFNYDSYLSLSRLGLPTGGYISYTWQNTPFRNCGDSNPISRTLKTRTVVPGNDQPNLTTEYQWPNPLPNNADWTPTFPIYSVVTDSNGNDTEYKIDSFYSIAETDSYQGCGPHNPNCQGPGTLLRFVSYTHQAYKSGGAALGTGGNPGCSSASCPILPTHETQAVTSESASGGQVVSQTVTNYAPGYGTCQQYTYPATPGGSENWPLDGGPAPTWSVQTIPNCYYHNQVNDQQFFDAGWNSPGSKLKDVSTTYLWQTNSSYQNANLLDFVQSVVTTDGTTGWIAQTNYGYDETGSPSGTHGNQTSTKKYVTSSITVTSSTQFNTNGVVTLKQDANGNQTSYGNFACNGSLPQTVIKPYGSSTTTPETFSYTYDCNLGKVTSVQDANTQKTTYTYADPLGRVTLANYPDNGSIAVQYSDATSPNAFPITMQVTTATGEVAGSKVATTTYDGLARPIETDTPESSSGKTIAAQTNYDDMGHEYEVSNPLYKGNETAYFTQSLYDALGRIVSTINPDGTSRHFCYNGIATAGQNNCHSYLGIGFVGSWTDSTDENGSDWQRASDGLGRLRRVMEPLGQPGTLLPSIETDYSYDALNDLLKVNQLGGAQDSGPRVRSFSYDGLSRLLCASNSENSTAACPVTYTGYVSGTTGYVYDNNGNVTTKTTPAPNTTPGSGSAVTVSYFYDALNRVLSKAYSNDATGTPSSCFQYDLSSVTNGIGRLAYSWTQSGVCPKTLPSSGVLTIRSLRQYDPMGRVWKEQQCTMANCTSGTPYSLNYSYDLIGNLTAYNDASGMQFTQTFDSVNRLLSLTRTLNGTTTTLFSPASFQGQMCPNTESSSWQYNAFGELVNASLGSGLSLNRSHDRRFRTTCEMDNGTIIANPTGGTALVTITGTEQSK